MSEGLEAMAKQAEAILPQEFWRYLAQSHLNPVDLRARFEQYCLMTRVLVNGTLSSNITLMGVKLDSPILVAPMAYQRLFHPDGEAAVAMAAGAQGTIACISSLASLPFSTIIRASRQGEGPLPWFQLYWQGNRECTAQLLDKAMMDGFEDVVFTVDAPVKMATLDLPPHITAVNLNGLRASTGNHAQRVADWIAQAPNWDDLVWLRSQFRGKLIVKGILNPNDADRAVDCGADAIVVSDHGGRVLPGVVPALAMLPKVVERVSKGVPVLYDSGILGGRDVFVALALGASAVMVGRPVVWGLAADGAMGVSRVLRTLRDELELCMALTGCSTVETIHRCCLCDAAS